MRLPKNINLRKVAVIGAGPAAIGQGAEYDGAVMEVCRVLKEEGVETIVIDSNPGALSTDPGVADRVYLMPLTPESLEQIICREQPDLLLAGFGGQTALNLIAHFQEASQAFPSTDISRRALVQTQNRENFRQLLTVLGWPPTPGRVVTGVTEGVTAGRALGFPLIIRGSFSMGGGSAALVYNQDELEAKLVRILGTAPAGPVVLETALVEADAITLELLRDREGRIVEVAVGEQLDPVGVHGGNSLVRFEPGTAMASWVESVLDKIRILLADLNVIGAIQVKLARHPVSGNVYCLDLNPRFTFNAMVASMIGGCPMAALAAKIALGYTLTEVLTEEDGDSCERRMALTVMKLPRFDLERFPGADPVLGPAVKATGAVLGIGDSPRAALAKAIRAVAKGWDGWEAAQLNLELVSTAGLKEGLTVARETRLFYLRDALKMGLSVEEIHRLSGLRRTFLEELSRVVALEKELSTYALYNLPGPVLLKAKTGGFSDRRLGELFRVDEAEMRAARERLGVYPTRRVVAGQAGAGEWCAIGYNERPAELESFSKPGVILVAAVDPFEGSGADDWNLIHGARGLQENGYRVILVAANPVTAMLAAGEGCRVYLEPALVETILTISQLERTDSVLLQFGGAAALTLAAPLSQAGLRIEGMAEDDFVELLQPDRLSHLLRRLEIAALRQDSATDRDELCQALTRLGFPALIRSGYRPGGAIVQVVYGASELNPVLEMLDRERAWPVTATELVDDAVAVMVDGLGDGKRFITAGIAEQIESADVHPGDSAFSIPPYSLDEELLTRVRELSGKLFKALALKGVLSLRWTVKHERLYLLEARPWAGESLAVLAKTGDIDWAAVAARAALGEALPDLLFGGDGRRLTAVKEAVFSFNRFPEVDPILGPVKRSLGMVLGLDSDFGMAFIKAQLGAGENIPLTGRIYLSIRNEDKRSFIAIAKQLLDFGFRLVAPEETAAILERNHIGCERVRRPGEGRPDVLDQIKNGEIHWIINTPSRGPGRSNEKVIRSAALEQGIPVITTLSGALAAVNGLKQYLGGGLAVRELDAYLREKS